MVGTARRTPDDVAGDCIGGMAVDVPGRQRRFGRSAQWAGGWLDLGDMEDGVDLKTGREHKFNGCWTGLFQCGTGRGILEKVFGIVFEVNVLG